MRLLCAIMKNMKKIIAFARKETVTTVSFVLALISMLFVKPDAGYADYVHWSTISTLMCLITVMSGLKNLGVFKYLGRLLLSHRNHARSVILILVGLCFFLAPFITNDVALITFVPFTIFVLEYAGLKKYIIPTLALQTIAAHMGSMISPIGNPHNIYLYELMVEEGQTDAVGFIMKMLPFSIAAAALLMLFVFVIARKNEAILKRKFDQSMNITGEKMAHILMYTLLFALSLLPVFGVVKYYYVLPVVIIATLVFDRTNLFTTNYSLLLTFIFLFIVVGNLGRIDVINNTLTSLVSGNELIVSVLASQVISNAPASILLSGFSDRYFLLALGTDMGGLGTLIAAMANLISFKEYTEMKGAETGKYILQFTIINVIFLIPMLILAILIGESI